MNNETKLKNILTANPELITPNGLDDLFAGVVKPTPAFQAMPFLAIMKNVCNRSSSNSYGLYEQSHEKTSTFWKSRGFIM